MASGPLTSTLLLALVVCSLLAAARGALEGPHGRVGRQQAAAAARSVESCGHRCTKAGTMFALVLG